MSGAAVSIVSECTYRCYLYSVKLKKSRVSLRTWEQLALRLIVVSGDGPSLLGREWLSEMEIDWKTLCQQSHVGIHRVPCGGPESSIENLLGLYSDLFQNELGKLTRFKSTLKVLPEAQPKFHRPRSVLFVLKEAIERELDRLEMAGVIEKTTHCNWAAPIVVVPKKDGTVQLCGDYKVSVNQTLVVDKYPLPKPSDMFATLAGGSGFLNWIWHKLILRWNWTDEESR